MIRVREQGLVYTHCWIVFKSMDVVRHGGIKRISDALLAPGWIICNLKSLEYFV